MMVQRTSAAMAALISLAACAETELAPRQAGADGQVLWALDFNGDLNGFLDCIEAAQTSLVSAHRGGPARGLPENAVETFAATLAQTPALIEVDVASTSDGVLFLMHDDSLDRTTSGTGRASDKSWSQISALALRDAKGRRTDFAPPKFSDVLEWAADRTVLQVDFKRSARYEDVIAEINRQGAEDRVILIAYSMGSARKLHRLAPDMMISLSIDTQTDVNEAVAAGIPEDRLLAFTGVEEPMPRLNGILDQRDIEVIHGTLGRAGSIDEEIERTGNEERYGEIARGGVDIIATDRPREAHAALARAGRAPLEGMCGVTRR